MTDYINYGLWKNDKREKDTHPILKASKPVDIGGQDYWLSAYINIPKNDNGDLDSRVRGFVNYMAEKLDKTPIVTISLSEAEPQRGQGGSAQRTPPPQTEAEFDDDIPF